MAEKFHPQLDDLKTDIIGMADLSQEMLTRAMEAMIDQDTGLAGEVIAEKETLREMNDRLEERAYQMIALYQPMATDMRKIACGLKVIASSDRIGRYGKDIAKIVEDISDKPHIEGMMSIPYMANLVTGMIHDAITAYETEDLALIADLSKRDDCVDSLRYSLFREAITYMIEDPKTISRCTNYIMVSRYLERCADHACKIAEYVHYMVTGERIEIH
jgi:phosphate transport system protein